MGKNRASKTRATGIAVGLTIYSKQFGSGQGCTIESAAYNRMLRRMMKGQEHRSGKENSHG